MRLSESGSVHESDLPTYGTHCKTEVAGVNANESGEWGSGGTVKGELQYFGALFFGLLLSECSQNTSIFEIALLWSPVCRNHLAPKRLMLVQFAFVLTFSTSCH